MMKHIRQLHGTLDDPITLLLNTRWHRIDKRYVEIIDDAGHAWRVDNWNGRLFCVEAEQDMSDDGYDAEEENGVYCSNYRDATLYLVDSGYIDISRK